MNKDVRLEYPKLDNEVITVKGFLNLKSAKIKTGKITVLIGEQASGKSVLAKIQYFFWKYQSDLFTIRTLSKETMAGYNKSQVDEFFRLFSVIDKNLKPFKIEYKNKDIKICLERTIAGHKPKITTSDFLQELYEERKADYNQYKKDIEETSPEEDRTPFVFRARSYWFSSRERRIFRDSTPTALYVPAVRSFFTTIKENLFTLLSEEAKYLDPLVIEFGSFFEHAKRRNRRHSSYEIGKNNRWGVSITKDILKGNFIQENDEDIIRAPWGDVELRYASSGQQEALPLILALLYFPYFARSNQLLIIEEPEAHIYPLSQRALIKMISEVARKKNCNVIITTHSPYIPACVNNEIILAQNKGKTLAVSAYCLSKRTARDVYHKSQDLIDMNELDEVSDEIADEYYDLTQEQDSPKNDKDKNRE